MRSYSLRHWSESGPHKARWQKHVITGLWLLVAMVILAWAILVVAEARGWIGPWNHLSGGALSGQIPWP